MAPEEEKEYEIGKLMEKYRAYKAAPKVPEPAPDMDAVQGPPIGTMTSASTVPPMDSSRMRGYPGRAPELADDIVARPLVAPDFVMDVRKHLVNQNLWPRWIFTDRRRFMQAKSQGWRVAKAEDFKPEFVEQCPYKREHGTKFVNGDLVLMLIDRKIYLGALRHKHEIAANFSDNAIASQIAKQRSGGLGPEVNAYNKWLERQGKQPAMEMYDPHDEVTDFKGAMRDPAVAAQEVSRMGGTRDTGKLSDLADQAKEGNDGDSNDNGAGDGIG